MDQELRILLLEDAASDAELIVRELSKVGIAFDHRRADNRESFIRLLDEFHPELILSDYKLPAFDGLAALALTRGHYRDMPFIFVTGTVGEEQAVELLKQGATDYVLKDNLERLGLAVKRALEETEERSKRVQAEAQIRKLNQELEQRVAERTQELKEANQKLWREKQEQVALIKKLEDIHNQLLQSEKMAAIGLLAAGVAHEINNPISYVQSNLRTLKKYVASLFELITLYESAEVALCKNSEAFTQAQQFKREKDLDFLRQDLANLLAESQEGITRVKTIVQDLKDFSHVDQATWQWTDLNHGIESTLNVVWNELKYKARVVKEYGRLPEVRCLPQQLNQVFMNLLVNAAQAIEERGTITIRTFARDDRVNIVISDTGSGIAPANLSRIFDPFFTTKPVGMGTGLGLSLAHTIIEKHQGSIEVESELGKGTTFHIDLPIDAAPFSPASSA